ETLNLYRESIDRMTENPGIPRLFREIFNNAYLPYRDPETLRAFLKVIDEFTYDHSERLGDAFEYLLSVLGSQGDAGQFRTPRHIIDFIVAIVDPQKDEKILDPACGTAGFLISSFKHIQRANLDAEGESMLTPDDRARLADNLNGYDISPDMVRLSLVNMYLHGFSAPQIHEYDTLTSLDRWNEYADVILANPPFMSPKGGIRPHNRFSIKSKRSEVLFVDYIAEHLTPAGRAGIIVPEGIIFQSQTAHKRLRQMLVEEYLVAVISLPAGVFNPYSGVKTSILILDRALARRADTIAFFKVENDGYDLGAQRRPIDRNDLPRVQAEVGEYLRRLRAGETLDDYAPTSGLVVEKQRIAANGEYNLSRERYHEGNIYNHVYPLVVIGNSKLFRVESGGTPRSDNEEYWDGGIPWITLVDLPSADFITEIHSTQRTISDRGLKESSAKLIPANSVIVSTRATIGRIGINRIPLATNQGFKSIVIEDPQQVLPEYVAFMLTKLVPTMNLWATGGTFKEISKSQFCKLQIPLPPIEVQREIVAEIEGYRRVIDGARAVLENYRPRIPVDPSWPLVELGEMCALNPRKSEIGDLDASTEVSFVPMSDIGQNEMYFDAKSVKRLDEVVGSYTYFRNGDVLLAKVTPCFENGKAGIARHLMNGIGFGSSEFYVLRPNDSTLSEWIFLCITTDSFRSWAAAQMTGTGGLQRVPRSVLESYKIPLPPLPVQQQIVAEIEAERALVEANRELIARFERKIEAVIARVWGDEAGAEEAAESAAPISLPAHSDAAG
ncbi:MAG: N-6 DNA methylase, partial [Anaerolineae bacterium]